MTRAQIAAIVVVVATVAAAGRGVAALPADRGYDGRAHIQYVEVLRAGHLPSAAQTYEYSTPPAYPWIAVQAQRVADALGVLPNWRAGQVVSALWLVVELVLAYALARELVPERPWLAVAALAATAAVPIVLRLGVMLHPESQFAALVLLALWLFVRGSRRGWPLRYAAGVGAALGLAALTRQSAAVVIVALGAVALGMRAFRFTAVAAVAVALVAGPWWTYQGFRYGNPLQSNLERHGYMVKGGEPLSFYFSAPVRDLVVHPYRPRFENRLLPQLYADLWSDWFGGAHFGWTHPSRAARVFTSTQSVSAFPLTLFAIVALVTLGVRALRSRDVPLATFLVLTILSWLAFVVEIVRFPQAGGDPIESSYMLYLAPVFAVAGVVAAAQLGRRARYAVAAAAGAYAASYVGFVVTSY